jgi:hypothetical protein
MEHFADEFNAQLNKASASGSDSGSPAPQDVRTAPRAMAKLRKQVSRTKQILSANSEAPMSVEELWQDRDFRSTITREKFEELAGEGEQEQGWAVGWLAGPATQLMGEWVAKGSRGSPAGRQPQPQREPGC